MLNFISKVINRKRKEFSLYIKSLSLVYKSAPGQIIFLLFAIVLQGMVPGIAIWLASHVLDIIARPHGYSYFDITLLCLMWGGSLFLSNLITPWVISCQSNVSDRAVNRINIDIIKKSNSILNLSYYETPEFHNDIQVLQSQSNHKPINLVVTTVGLIRDLITAIFCILLLCTVTPWVSIVGLISAYTSFKVYAILQEKTWMESLGRSLESRKLAYISSVALGKEYAKEIRFFNFGNYLVSEYSKIFSKIYQRMRALRIKQAIWPLFPFTITVVGNLVAFFVVVTSAFQGQIRIGEVALFLQTLTQLHLSITSFGEQAGWLKGHMLFFEKFFNFLNIKENLLDSRHSVKLNNPDISIEFCNVSFSYQNGKNILKNISFSIKPREKIAIVGLNGAGKSTIIKLLCGLYPPTSGSILINDLPMTSIDIDDWRKKISPVFQDFNRYSFSLKQNIMMGLDEVDESKLNNTIKQSGVYEFVKTLPLGLQEPLGTNFGGVDLSNGQWQKVAIARALYKDSQILVLDEFSSTLDPISEYEIFNNFSTLMQNKTVIFITHRLNSVIMAERIILFNYGRLIAQGSHEELIQTNLIYKEMFEKQASGYLKLKERAKQKIRKHKPKSEFI